MPTIQNEQRRPERELECRLTQGNLSRVASEFNIRVGNEYTTGHLAEHLIYCLVRSVAPSPYYLDVSDMLSLSSSAIVDILVRVCRATVPDVRGDTHFFVHTRRDLFCVFPSSGRSLEYNNFNNHPQEWATFLQYIANDIDYREFYSLANETVGYGPGGVTYRRVPVATSSQINAFTDYVSNNYDQASLLRDQASMFRDRRLDESIFGAPIYTTETVTGRITSSNPSAEYIPRTRSALDESMRTAYETIDTMQQRYSQRANERAELFGALQNPVKKRAKVREDLDKIPLPA